MDNVRTSMVCRGWLVGAWVRRLTSAAFAVVVGASAVCAVFAVGGCQQVSDRDLEVVEAGQVARWSEQGEAMLVDVRSAEDYEAGHIDGAVRIALADLRGDDPRLGAAERVVVYGRDVFDNRGPAGVKKLLGQGVDDVYLFRGGWEQWAQWEQRGD